MRRDVGFFKMHVSSQVAPHRSPLGRWPAAPSQVVEAGAGEMSASERLSKLEQHINRPISGSVDEITAARFLLAEALPELIAVVEAAEAVAWDSEIFIHGKDGDAVGQLAQALSALDARLANK